MKKHPILFSAPMVRAIQAGTKSQTRRVMKLQPAEVDNYDDIALLYTSTDEDRQEYTIGQPPFKCPYGEVGDVLWVRETWRRYYPTDEHGNIDLERPIIEYAADNPDPVYLSDADGGIATDSKGNEKLVPFKPSIHMPYDLCRLFLKITSIRVERLQDINLNDARAEGIVETWGDGGRSLFPADQPHEYDNRTSVENFTKLWQMINGAESWAENPWVWVLEFEPTEKPA